MIPTKKIRIKIIIIKIFGKFFIFYTIEVLNNFRNSIFACSKICFLAGFKFFPARLI